MKPVIYLLFVTVLMSCGDNDQSAFGNLPQQWELTRIHGSMTGQVIEKENLPYAETLLFNKDSTFLKTRQENSSMQEATGTFHLMEDSGSIWVRLEYDSENALIENCSGNNSELLRIVSKDLLSGGAIACDGPGYDYTRVNSTF